jgi:hypothetical protein
MNTFIKQLFCIHDWISMTKWDWLRENFSHFYNEMNGFDYYKCRKCNKYDAVTRGTVKVVLR